MHCLVKVLFGYTRELLDRVGQGGAEEADQDTHLHRFQ